MPHHRVISSYQRSYETPIVGAAGDRVKVGRQDEEAPSWHWCEHTSSGLVGWVPETVLNFEAGQSAAVLRCCYSAMELTVVEGQIVTVLEAMDGWSWCDAGNDGAGWVPSDKLILSS